MNGFNDAMVIVYVLLMMITGYGAGLFIWWGNKSDPSYAFVYVGLLFVGEFIESAVSLYSRLLRACNNIEEFSNFITSPWWPLRKIITLVVMTIFVIYMSYRAFWLRKKQGEGERRAK